MQTWKIVPLRKEKIKFLKKILLNAMKNTTLIITFCESHSVPIGIIQNKHKNNIKFLEIVGTKCTHMLQTKCIIHKQN